MKTSCLSVTSAVLMFACGLWSSQTAAQEQAFDPEALKQIAERGNMDAQFELGIRFLSGEGFPKDEKKAAEWLMKSAEQQNLPAMNAVGTLHEQGLGLPKDEKKAFEWFEKAAKYGFPLAQQNLAECYELGRGVEKNPGESLKWLERAAHQDFPPAQAAYAWKLEHGEGSSKNTREAARWYLTAAQNGLVRAQTHLAYLYYTGSGVPLDYRRAEAWYRRAARSEDPWASNDLAWFLAVCPDENFHDAETAVEFSRSAAEKLSDSRYEILDTLAAALARSGKFGEAVQLQMKVLMVFDKDKNEAVKPEERAKLEQELSERLKYYKKQSPFTEKDPKPETGTKPLIEDRILQEEAPQRRKPKPTEESKDDDDRGKPVVVS